MSDLAVKYNDVCIYILSFVHQKMMLDEYKIHFYINVNYSDSEFVLVAWYKSYQDRKRFNLWHSTTIRIKPEHVNCESIDVEHLLIDGDFIVYEIHSVLSLDEENYISKLSEKFEERLPTDEICKIWYSDFLDEMNSYNHIKHDKDKVVMFLMEYCISHNIPYNYYGKDSETIFFDVDRKEKKPLNLCLVCLKLDDEIENSIFQSVVDNFDYEISLKYILKMLH